jgi:glycosyltransferase involved in cell wall biosynthesis
MPPLEAMACGAPVIASGSTSLAEVIGWDLATFDPFNLTEMSAKIEYALTDLQFRTALRNHGERQARRFSWDLTAQKAIQAWEQLAYKTL